MKLATIHEVVLPSAGQLATTVALTDVALAPVHTIVMTQDLHKLIVPLLSTIMMPHICITMIPMRMSLAPAKRLLLTMRLITGKPCLISKSLVIPLFIPVMSLTLIPPQLNTCQPPQTLKILVLLT